MPDQFHEWVRLFSNLITIATAAVGVYFYFTKREKVTATLKGLMNYATMLSRNDLLLKLEILENESLDDDHSRMRAHELINAIFAKVSGRKSTKTVIGKTLFQTLKSLSTGDSDFNRNQIVRLTNELRERIMEDSTLTFSST